MSDKFHVKSDKFQVISDNVGNRQHATHVGSMQALSASTSTSVPALSVRCKSNKEHPKLALQCATRMEQFCRDHIVVLESWGVANCEQV